MDLRSLTWRKARRSTENGGDCVEVAAVSDTILIRDSNNPNGPKLLMSRNDLRRLTATLKNQ
ncbi:DUF397 domain-containing protein [Actinomadura chibensis]|uniref:DUF397 domain-containing protein n=1 Tax=Actinomadura chibensis TaxID=392828 RepID=A0A5D0NZI4_9ACTN|nr:DUF397 domain-containing protein [Actinomadura chibensis]TYB49554.1 DUF397 domain-containing protein [Actinomadura chibensis]